MNLMRISSVLMTACMAAALCACSDMLAEKSGDSGELCGTAPGGCAPAAREINPVIEWEWTGSAVAPASNQAMSAPAVASLNDDNGDGIVDTDDIPDIVFVTFSASPVDYQNNGILRAVSGDGSGELFSVTGYNISPATNIALGDIDRDGLVEIVVREGNTGGTDGTSRLLAFNNDGTFLWRSTSAETSGAIGISIADIDRDGSPDILTDTTVVNSAGVLQWTGTTTGRRNAIAVNLDCAGDLEVVMANTAYRSDGSVYWQNTSIGGTFYFVAAGNFDADPNPEIIMVISNQYVYCLEHDGAVKWGPVSILRDHNTYTSVPVVTDADGDGEPEIAVSTADGVTLMETGGTIMWQSAGQDYSSGMVGCSAFDFNADGANEIVQNDETTFRIFNGADGAVLYNVNIGSATLYEIPVIVDVDNDSQAEIVVAANNYVPAFNFGHAGIVVFGDTGKTWPNAGKIWNQGDFNPVRVGRKGEIPAHEGSYWLRANHSRQGVITEPVADSDLVVIKVTVDSDSYPAAVTVTAEISNSGPNELERSVFVAFYDGDPSAGGTYLGRASIYPSMGLCDVREADFTWLAPGSGAHAIYAVADSDGGGRSRICELDRENNTGSVLVEFL